jgi:hypothetical protein
LQRDPNADLSSCLRQAHRAFLMANVEEIDQHIIQGTTLFLPAGPGLLLCNAVCAADHRGRPFTFAMARTFITSSQAGPDQKPIAPASDLDRSQLVRLSATTLRSVAA